MAKTKTNTSTAENQKQLYDFNQYHKLILAGKYPATVADDEVIDTGWCNIQTLRASSFQILESVWNKKSKKFPWWIIFALILAGGLVACLLLRRNQTIKVKA